MTADPDYPPLSWSDGRALQGVAFDLAGLALDRMGVPYEIRDVGPFPRILREARQGGVDLIVSLKNIEERRAYLTFTQTPVARNPIAAFVRNGSGFVYRGRDDLQGLRGAMVQGNRFGEDFDQFIAEKLTVDQVPGLRQAFTMMERGRVDYVLTGLLTGQSYVLRTYGQELFVPVTPYLTDVKNYAAFAKASPCARHLVAFDRVLADLINHGEFDRLLRKHMERVRPAGTEAGR